MGCIFPMVIWSEFRLRKYRDDDLREDASHFTIWYVIDGVRKTVSNTVSKIKCQKTLKISNFHFRKSILGHKFKTYSITVSSLIISAVLFFLTKYKSYGIVAPLNGSKNDFSISFFWSTFEKVEFFPSKRALESPE